MMFGDHLCCFGPMFQRKITQGETICVCESSGWYSTHCGPSVFEASGWIFSSFSFASIINGLCWSFASIINGLCWSSLA